MTDAHDLSRSVLYIHGRVKYHGAALRAARGGFTHPQDTAAGKVPGDKLNGVRTPPRTAWYRPARVAKIRVQREPLIYLLKSCGNARARVY